MHYFKRNWTLIKVNLKNMQQYGKSPEGNKENSSRNFEIEGGRTTAFCIDMSTGTEGIIKKMQLTFEKAHIQGRTER